MRAYLRIHGIEISQEGRQRWRWFVLAFIEIHCLLGVRWCARVVQWCQRKRLGE